MNELRAFWRGVHDGEHGRPISYKGKFGSVRAYIKGWNVGRELMILHGFTISGEQS